VPDVRIVSSASLRGTVADWLLLPTGNLDESGELANYAKLALMTDRLADNDEVLPDPDSTDRRGWWGDMDAGAIWQGWPIGTKNWLLTRAKIADVYAWEGDTVVRAENYTRAALQPMIDRKMCSAIVVQATRIGRERIDVAVTIYRGPQTAIQLIFQDMWSTFQDDYVDRLAP
jgi:phage gp46-like protein